MAGILVPAVVGGGVAVGVVAATGNLGGGGTSTTTVVRETIPAAATGSAAPSGSSVDVTNRTSGSESVQEIARRSAPSIVVVQATTSDGQGLGTGFVTDRGGHILTNAHVVSGAKQVRVSFDDKSTREARVLGVDETMDVAVLKVDDLPASATPLPLGSSGSLVVGDPVVAIGNPLGFEQTVTTGIVSALKRVITSPNDSAILNAIQTDAAINQGNSGGPLLDQDGRVIGINSQIASENGGNVGIGFAIPIDAIRPVANSIIATGHARHAWMGIRGQELTPDVARALGRPGLEGVAVVSVDRRGPAARVGLQPSTAGENARVPKGADVIVAVDGAPVEDMADVNKAVSDHAVGERISVTVLRNGTRVTKQLTLADRPSDLRP
jgi:S1-C subfamily serine protease